MLWEEYDKEEYKRLFREEYVQEGIEIGRKEGRQEGQKEGRQEGRKEGRQLFLVQMISSKLKKGKTAVQIAEDLDMQLEEVQPLVELIQRHSELSSEELCRLEKSEAV